MTAPGRGEMLALSLPTFIFAGYELARKSFLPALLIGGTAVGGGGLGLAQAGTVLAIMGTWSIAVEVIFGMICDMAPDPRRRRAFWVMVGTGLQLIAGAALLLMPKTGPGQGHSMAMWLACLLTLSGGWVLSNLAHGAWALERASGVAARARIFGVRAQFGTVGSVAFALIVLLVEHRFGGLAADPFYIVLGLTMLGAPLAHALLIWRVEERGAVPAVQATIRPRLAHVLKPFQVCIASPADRLLAGLFLLVGAHMGLIGSSLVFLVRHSLALPAWGTQAILAQAVAAVAGLVGAQRLLRHASPLQIIVKVFAINLALALALPLLPPGQVGPLLAWAGSSGATMAVDFTLLRVLLGQRLDREAQRDGTAPAAAFYAGFHLPFNLGSTMAVAALFQGLAWAGVDLGDARQAGVATDGLVWLTAGFAAVFSALAMAGAMGLGVMLKREGEAVASRPLLNFRIFCALKKTKLTEPSS